MSFYALIPPSTKRHKPYKDSTMRKLKLMMLTATMVASTLSATQALAETWILERNRAFSVSSHSDFNSCLAAQAIANKREREKWENRNKQIIDTSYNCRRLN